jgi:hypothetical protein
VPKRIPTVRAEPRTVAYGESIVPTGTVANYPDACHSPALNEMQHPLMPERHHTHD